MRDKFRLMMRNLQDELHQRIADGEEASEVLHELADDNEFVVYHANSLWLYSQYSSSEADDMYDELATASTDILSLVSLWAYCYIYTELEAEAEEADYDS